jgi:hypothetical protein
VYSDRTRGEMQVAKNNFFCSDIYICMIACYKKDLQKKQFWFWIKRKCFKYIEYIFLTLLL